MKNYNFRSSDAFFNACVDCGLYNTEVIDCFSVFRNETLGFIHGLYASKAENLFRLELDVAQEKWKHFTIFTPRHLSCATLGTMQAEEDF